MDKVYACPWIKSSKDEWRKIDDTTKLDIVIRSYVPWHIEFLLTWLSQNKYDYLLLDFNLVVDDTESALVKTLDYLEIKFNKGDIDRITTKYKKKKIAFNKGLKNRGIKILNNKQIKTIHEFIESRNTTNLNIFNIMTK